MEVGGLDVDILKQLCSDNHRVESDNMVQTDDILMPEHENHLVMNQETARRIDERLSVQDAISLTFLLSNEDNLYYPFRVAWCLEQQANEKNCIVINNDSQAPGGVVELHFRSFMKNNAVSFEGKLMEALYHNSNNKILKDEFSVLRQDFKKFNHLSPTVVYLHQVCNEAVQEQASELCRKASLAEFMQIDGVVCSLKTLEVKFLYHMVQNRLTMDQFLHKIHSYIPPELKMHLPSRDCGAVQDRCYPKGKGFVIIFNHELFYMDPAHPSSKNLTNREGTNVDRDNLDNVFEYLGASERRIYDNFTLDQMRAAMERDAEYVNAHHYEFTWMAVCIMTHGNRSTCGQDLVYSSNGLPMDRTEIIMKFVDRDQIPNFEGKPRFFFFVACRTEEETVPQLLPAKENIEADSPAAVVYQDITREEHLVCSSTIDSHSSFRSTTEGTFYVQALSKNLREHASNLDILKILTRVNQDMRDSFRRDYPSMSEMSVNTLSADFYFDVPELQEDGVYVPTSPSY